MYGVPGDCLSLVDKPMRGSQGRLQELTTIGFKTVLANYEVISRHRYAFDEAPDDALSQSNVRLDTRMSNATTAATQQELQESTAQIMELLKTKQEQADA